MKYILLRVLARIAQAAVLVFLILHDYKVAAAVLAVLSCAEALLLESAYSELKKRN